MMSRAPAATLTVVGLHWPAFAVVRLSWCDGGGEEVATWLVCGVCCQLVDGDIVFII